jgi:RimJ/RimL family protein N-acetyltransferase
MIGKSLFIGDQIELTALDPEKDAEALSTWSSDKEFVGQFLEGPFRQYPIYELKKKVKEILKKADENNRSYYFAVRKKEDPTLVGLLRFGWIWPSQQVGRLFLDFGTEESRRLYGAEVLKMALRYAFMELSFHRLWAELPGNNLAKMELYEKAGFLREVQRREAVFFDGKYYDEITYSILKPEWKKSQVEVQS